MVRLLASLSLLGLLAACSDAIDDSCPAGTVPDGKVCAQPSGGAAGSVGGGGAGGTAGGSGVGGGAGAAGAAGVGGAAGAAGAAGQAGGASPGGASGGGGVSGASGSSGGGTAGGAGVAGAGGIAQGGGAGQAGTAGQAGGAGTAAGAAGTGAGGTGSAGKAGGSTCGNGSVDGVEQCDGADLGGKVDCTHLAPGTVGKLECLGNCTFDTSGCISTICGDGKLEGVEECEKVIPAGVTCAALLGSNYSEDEKPGCDNKCRVDYTPCKPIDGHLGPKMVLLGSEFGFPVGTSIGATEVTRAQYSQFLRLSKFDNITPSDVLCAWKSDAAPSSSCLLSSCLEPGLGCATHPQTCVDFCDAEAFCQYSGRHLCGGPGGAAVASDKGTTADDLWFTACRSGGVYFYSDEYQPGACNTAESGIAGTQPVGTAPACHSGYAKHADIMDMLGNAQEWEHSGCQTNVLGQVVCMVRGDSFAKSHSEVGCFSAFHLENITTRAPDIGFRCCD